MERQIWEYRIYDTYFGVNPDDESELNYLGVLGWELVGMKPSDYEGYYRFYFKRLTGLGKYASKE